MDLTGIISVAGKPGLFKVIAQGKNSLIVESLIDGKRMPAYSTERISALDDISIYTTEEDIPLKDVLQMMLKKENGGPVLSHKENLSNLTEYLTLILPNYDRERIYPSDIKKLFQWYNLLQKAGIIKLEEEKVKKPSTEVKEKTTAKKVTKTSASTSKIPTSSKASSKTTAAKVPSKKAPQKKG
jgi:hypothetical protein